MPRQEEQLNIYDPETGRNKSGYTKEESRLIQFRAEKSRELDPERGVWSQRNITATKLIERANAVRVIRGNGHQDGPSRTIEEFRERIFRNEKGYGMTDEHTNGSTPAGPQDLVYDPLNPIWVNGCSGNVETHQKSCDGNCERRPVTALEIDLHNENNAWIRAGMDPRRIQVDAVEMNIKIRALSRIIEKELGISEEQQNIHYAEFKLEYLREIRTENEERVRKQKLESMVPKKAPMIDPRTGRPFKIDPLG